MQTPNFLSRMGGWFKAGGSRGNTAADSAELGDDGLLKPPNDLSSRGGVSMLLSRWHERSQSLERLEEGYQRLTELVDAIQTHLQTQDERSRMIANGLNSMAEHVARLPDALQQQHNQLAAIVEQLERAGAHSGRMEAVLAELPKIVDGQRQTLLAVGDQIEASTRTQQGLVDSISGFSDAVGALNQSSTASMQTLRNVQASAEASQNHLANLFTEQSRRLSRLISVGLVVAAVLAVATIVSMLR